MILQAWEANPSKFSVYTSNTRGLSLTSLSPPFFLLVCFFFFYFLSSQLVLRLNFINQYATGFTRANQTSSREKRFLSRANSREPNTCSTPNVLTTHRARAHEPQPPPATVAILSKSTMMPRSLATTQTGEKFIESKSKVLRPDKTKPIALKHNAPPTLIDSTHSPMPTNSLSTNATFPPSCDDS